MKVLLVVPNYNLADEENHIYYAYAPYNLVILASMIRDMCDVEILDAYVNKWSLEELKKEIEQRRPDVVGITVLMDQMSKTGHDVARITKEIGKEIKVLMGGVYVTMNPEHAISDENVDYICIGEGEYVIQELIKFFKGEIKQLPAKGVAFRENGELINRGRYPFIGNLDAIPDPSYDLIEFSRYSQKVTRGNSVDSPRTFPYARLYTSRGCPFDCSFCQVGAIAGRPFRRQSVEKVIHELRLLRDQYGIRSYIISDDNFFLNRKRVVELLTAIIDNDLVMPWLSEDTGVMHLDKELLDLMAKSGCEYIGCAIETGNDRIMSDIIKGKKFTKEHAKEMVSYAKELGMYTAANFIIGFPTETWDEIRETLDFAENLNSDYIRIFNLVPLKQTELWEICEKENAFIDGYSHFNLDASWNAAKVQSPEFSANDLTVLRTFEWDRINFSDPSKRAKTAGRLGKSLEELSAMRKETIDNMYRKIDVSRQKYGEHVLR